MAILAVTIHFLPELPSHFQSCIVILRLKSAHFLAKLAKLAMRAAAANFANRFNLLSENHTNRFITRCGANAVDAVATSGNKSNCVTFTALADVKVRGVPLTPTHVSNVRRLTLLIALSNNGRGQGRTTP
jgi:hypothetical protein